MERGSSLGYGGGGPLRPYESNQLQESAPRGDVYWSGAPRSDARAKERWRAKGPPATSQARRYESNVEDNSPGQQRKATTLPICHWKPGENTRHGGANCVI